MLLQLYPRVHRRYSSLSVFGPIVENFGAWLVKQGYSTDCVREHFCCMRRIARLLRKRGVGTLDQLTKAILDACAPADRLDDKRLAASVRLLVRYFESETSLFATPALNSVQRRVADYATYVGRVRGLGTRPARPPSRPTFGHVPFVARDQTPARSAGTHCSARHWLHVPL